MGELTYQMLPGLRPPGCGAFTGPSGSGHGLLLGDAVDRAHSLDEAS